MTPRTFTCDNCGKVSETNWSDKEAVAECKDIFGAVPSPEDRAVICDDCFDELRTWMLMRLGAWMTDHEH